MLRCTKAVQLVGYSYYRDCTQKELKLTLTNWHERHFHSPCYLASCSPYYLAPCSPTLRAFTFLFSLSFYLSSSPPHIHTLSFIFVNSNLLLFPLSSNFLFIVLCYAFSLFFLLFSYLSLPLFSCHFCFLRICYSFPLSSYLEAFSSLLFLSTFPLSSFQPFLVL